MKISKLLLGIVSGLVVLGTAAGCVPPDIDEVVIIPDDDIYGGIDPATGKSRNLQFKKEFRSVTSMPSTINYIGRTDGGDLSHIANFVDGLVTNDAYGRLVKNLATNATTSNNDTIFTFTIKKNVKWLEYDGTHKRYAQPGVAQPTLQYVTAHDFLFTARQVLDPDNLSDNSFMIAMFIKGAAEFYAYKKISTTAGFSGWSGTKRAEELAKVMLDMFNITREFIDPTTVDQYADFTSVGYKAIDDHTLRFELTTPAPFFPTMLAYAPFLPINEAYYMSSGIGKAGFGTAKNKILYCGPYLWGEDQPNLVYHRNKEFHGNWKGEDMSIVDDKIQKEELWPAKMERVIYQYIPTSGTIGEDYARTLFERGEIDGFSINSKDADGWKAYVSGPDGTGTLQYDPDNIEQYPGPHRDEVNARFYDNIDYTWHLALAFNRSDELNTESSLTQSELINANKALKIREVRDLYLKSFDFAEHSKRHGNVEIERTQSSLNTFIPRGFAWDEDNKDYVDHFYEAYATAETALGNPTTVDEAATKFAPGQFDTMMMDKADIVPLKEKAVKAVELYNVGKSVEDQIKFPVVIEANWSLSNDTINLPLDRALFRSINNRINNRNDSTPEPGTAADKRFFIELNEKISSSTTLSNVLKKGNTHLPVWGWQADYGDPLSYLNAYVHNGDMAFALGTANEVKSWKLNPAGDALIEIAHTMGEYSDLVENASKQVEHLGTRFAEFAKAEYLLLEDLAIMLPLYNRGQGWNASVSRSFGYGAPSAPYGLASNRLINLWTLVEVPSRALRYDVYDLFLRNRTEARKDGIISIF